MATETSSIERGESPASDEVCASGERTPLRDSIDRSNVAKYFQSRNIWWHYRLLKESLYENPASQAPKIDANR
jgi:hypothetical protein